MAKLKYEQIADHLRERITNGEFRPGDLLPSGRDLCEQWGVSRATVIKAMDVLRADGAVVARQGSGFTVVDTPVARPAGRRGSGARVVGAHPFRRLGTPTRERPPQRIADALQLDPGELALRRARLILLDEGSALTLVNAWFPPDIADACPRLASEGPLAEGTTTYVTRTTGRSSARGMDVHTARLATDEEAGTLGTTTPTAVAVTLHTAFDAEGLPLVCEEGVTPGELWELTDSYPMGS
ncbi:GntR family transcriptional regulator [Streptomyces mayteni]